MKILTIIKKEYREIVKKKSFIISTILTPVIMLGFMFIPMLLLRVGKAEKKIAVADYTGYVYQEIIKKEDPPKPMDQDATKDPLADRGNRESKIAFQSVETMDRTEQALIDEHKEAILSKKLDGLLIIPNNVQETRRVKYYGINLSDFDTTRLLGSAIRSAISRKVLLEKAIDPAIVTEATRDVAVETSKVKKEGVTKTSSGMEYIMSMGMLSLLFSILMAYGQLLMRGIIEEKNNRIIEVLISSTDSLRLFFGKILGIGLAGLTQVGIWVLLAALLMGKFAGGSLSSMSNFLNVQVGIYMVIFFVLGYFMFSILFAIVGASVNSDQEAQQFAAPIIYLLIIPFIMGIMVTQNPNTPLVMWASLFPLFSPTLMFMRILVAQPPIGQILLSIGLNLFTIIGLAWLGARIFRVGILMYGKRPSLGEMLRWLKYK